MRIPLQPGANTPWFELVRRHVPAARIEIVSGAGHFTMLEEPQTVNQLLAAFVVTVSRPS
jgi:pimeloyl-ACP methyl ester carboxylesterase